MRRPAMSGPRALVTGAVLYTAARALFIRAQRASKHAADTRQEGGAVKRPETTTSRPRRKRAPDKSVPPSLALPNQRWPRIAAARR